MRLRTILLSVSFFVNAVTAFSMFTSAHLRNSERKKESNARAQAPMMATGRRLTEEFFEERGGALPKDMVGAIDGTINGEQEDDCESSSSTEELLKNVNAQSTGQKCTVKRIQGSDIPVSSRKAVVVLKTQEFNPLHGRDTVLKDDGRFPSMLGNSVQRNPTVLGQPTIGESCSAKAARRETLSASGMKEVLAKWPPNAEIRYNKSERKYVSVSDQEEAIGTIDLLIRAVARTGLESEQNRAVIEKSEVEYGTEKGARFKKHFSIRVKNFLGEPLTPTLIKKVQKDLSQEDLSHSDSFFSNFGENIATRATRLNPFSWRSIDRSQYTEVPAKVPAKFPAKGPSDFIELAPMSGSVNSPSYQRGSFSQRSATLEKK